MRFFERHEPRFIQEIKQRCPGAFALECEAARLPDPGDDMAYTKWWKVGKKFLIESYPHPEFPGELNENVPTLNKLITARIHRRNRKALLNRIEYEMELNFERFAMQCQKSLAIAD
jgi:hypothetical protein